MTHQPPQTRYAEPEDFEHVVRLGMGQAAEAPWGAPSERRVRETARYVLSNGKVILALSGTKLVGQIALLHEQAPWSEDWQVTEMGLFVEPAHRHERHALHLLRAAERHAALVGLPLVLSPVGARVGGLLKVMRRRFGEPIGAVFYAPPKLEEA